MLRLACCALVAAISPQPAEVLAQIQVHGNTLTATEEIVRLSGLSPGMPLAAGTIADVEARLRSADRFERVEVRKRFASISDPSQVLLVIVVDEGPVRIDRQRDEDASARAVRRGSQTLMFMPILGIEDGHGFTYGARFALVDVAGPGSRLSFPATWGGERRAGIELDKAFHGGPFSRLQIGAAVQRRVNPFFDEPDVRRRASLRAERALAPQLRVGATAGGERVRFLDKTDRFTFVGADVVLDTRLDPFLARNAVFGRAAWQRVALDAPVSRTELEAEGYLGLAGQSVLVARLLREDASGPLPGYLKSQAGGMDNLRGFGAASAIGDALAAASLELRLPLTSPLSVGKLGVSAFVDAAAAYDNGARLRDQRFERGVGGAVWFSAAMLRFNVAVARGIGSSTRAHVASTLVF